MGQEQSSEFDLPATITFQYGDVSHASNKEGLKEFQKWEWRTRVFGPIRYQFDIVHRDRTAQTFEATEMEDLKHRISQELVDRRPIVRHLTVKMSSRSDLQNTADFLGHITKSRSSKEKADTASRDRTLVLSEQLSKTAREDHPPGISVASIEATSITREALPTRQHQCEAIVRMIEFDHHWPSIVHVLNIDNSSAAYIASLSKIYSKYLHVILGNSNKRYTLVLFDRQRFTHSGEGYDVEHGSWGVARLHDKIHNRFLLDVAVNWDDIPINEESGSESGTGGNGEEEEKPKDHLPHIQSLFDELARQQNMQHVSANNSAIGLTGYAAAVIHGKFGESSIAIRQQLLASVLFSSESSMVVDAVRDRMGRSQLVELLNDGSPRRVCDLLQDDAFSASLLLANEAISSKKKSFLSENVMDLLLSAANFELGFNLSDSWNSNSEGHDQNILIVGPMIISRKRVHWDDNTVVSDGVSNLLLPRAPVSGVVNWTNGRGNEVMHEMESVEGSEGQEGQGSGNP